MDLVFLDATGKILTGVGAFMAGCGSLLTGIAALRNARKQGAKEAKKDEKAV